MLDDMTFIKSRHRNSSKEQILTRGPCRGKQTNEQTNNDQDADAYKVCPHEFVFKLHGRLSVLARSITVHHRVFTQEDLHRQTDAECVINIKFRIVIRLQGLPKF